MKCLHCGKEINNNTVFCRYCGSKLKTEEEPHKDFTAKAALEQEAVTAIEKQEEKGYGIFESARAIGIVTAIEAGIIIVIAGWNY